LAPFIEIVAILDIEGGNVVGLRHEGLPFVLRF
jgi:hypothetical protein